MKNILLALAIGMGLPAISQTPNLHWNYQNDGQSYYEDRGICTAFDANGNIITVGYTDQGCSEIDIRVTKYSPLGDTLWSVTYDGSGTTGQEDQPRALAIDASGNIYVTGFSEDAAFPFAITLKYSPGGILLWDNKYILNQSTGNDIAVDASGNVYICGYREISNSMDFLVIKYNASGSQQWIQNYSNGNYDEALSMEVTATGDVYVTGRQSGVNFLFDWATLKYNTLGAQQWVDVFTNATFGYSEEPVELQISSAGNIFVTGSAPLASVSDRDYYLIKYDPAGNRLWEFSYSNTALNNDEYPIDMIVDAAENVFITGNAIFNPGGQDITTIKVNSDGYFVWEAHIDSIQQTDYARSVEMDPAGNFVYIAGDITVPPVGPISRDIIITKLDTNGTEVARFVQDGPGNNFDLPYDMAVNATTGMLAVTGMQSMQNAGNANGDASTFLITPQLTPHWVRNYNGDGFADDHGMDMVVDASGNSYVCGYTRGGDITYEDLVVFKVSPSGVRLWEYVYKGFEETSSEIGVAIAIDAQYNVYVTGTSDTSTSGNYRNIYTVKLNPSGQFIWDRTYNGLAGGDDYPVGIRVAPSGKIFIAGTTVNNGTGLDGIAIGYDNSGNLNWVTSYDNGSLGESFTCMEMNAAQEIYAAGFLNPASGTMSDGLLVKFSSAGTILWDTTYDFSTANNDRDFFNSIALDASGNVFVAGQSDLNFVTAKYASFGSPQWIQNYSYSNFTDSATTIAVDINGDVIVGGTFGQFVEADYGLVKYKNDGTFIWDQQFANSAGSDDILTDMVLDTSGNIYVTGWETDQFTTNYNFMTIKYDSTGTFEYELNWSDSLTIAPDYGKKIALDSIGNIYVMGDANENCSGNGFVNGYRWNTQVLRYGQGIFSGAPESNQTVNEIRVYPNPAGNQFNIELPESLFGKEPVEMMFYDVQGKLIFSTIRMPGETQNIDCGNWNSGMVFYVARNVNATFSGKLFLNND